MARSPRRDFLRTVGGIGAFAVSAEMLWRPPRAFSQQADPILAGRPLVRYPEKTDLILMTSRPPQLETPMTYFDRAITPNEAFFVRYHTFPVPTGVDLGTWRLRVTGLVERPLELSFEDLKTRFPKAAVTAVTQCAGNSRGRFSPRVLGGGGGGGGMGDGGRRPRVREVLDETGLPDSRHAVRLRRARHGAEEHRADPPHDGPLLHRRAPERRARRRRATRDAQGYRVRRRLWRPRGPGLRRWWRHVAARTARAGPRPVLVP